MSLDTEPVHGHWLLVYLKIDILILYIMIMYFLPHPLGALKTPGHGRNVKYKKKKPSVYSKYSCLCHCRTLLKVVRKLKYILNSKGIEFYIMAILLDTYFKN